MAATLPRFISRRHPIAFGAQREELFELAQGCPPSE